MGYIPYLFLHCAEMLVQILYHLSEDVLNFFAKMSYVRISC